MVSRGVQQLKNLRLYFCDFGGSSAGVRSLLQSADLVNFMDKNSALTLECHMKRNQHPYVSASYVNGYVKDIPLRGINEEEVLDYMTKATQQFGRPPLTTTTRKSSRTVLPSPPTNQCNPRSKVCGTRSSGLATPSTSWSRRGPSHMK